MRGGRSPSSPFPFLFHAPILYLFIYLFFSGVL